MGRIELIIGCMYSGKTTELMRQIMRYKTLNKKIMIITHSMDTRYSDAGNIATHNKETMNAVPMTILENAFSLDLFRESEIIFIEEAQFFPDLVSFTTIAANKHNKTVIVCGLDGDFQLKPFEQVVQLIPQAERVQKFNALCKKCGDGTEACFSKRIVSSSERELVGSDGVYEAVCRYHYYN
jgi:thymidine kinase